jgi:hypothetical protein
MHGALQVDARFRLHGNDVGPGASEVGGEDGGSEYDHVCGL